MRQTDIHILIERFFDGDTTLAEERQIYAYFRRSKIADDLMPYRQMFCDIAAMQPAKKKSVRPALLRWAASIAASLLIAVGLHAAWNAYQYHQLSARYEGSYVIENGQHNDNLLTIRPQIEQALAEASHMEASFSAEDIINQSEQEVLDNVSDPALRQEIASILNQ